LSEESSADDGAVEAPTLFIPDECIQVIPIYVWYLSTILFYYNITLNLYMKLLISSLTIIPEQHESRSSCNQTSNLLSSNTPRKNKLRKIINTQKQRLKRLRSINQKKQQKRMAIEQAISILPAKIVRFVESQIDLHSTKVKNKAKNI
jgi:cell division protein FtsL